MNTMIICYKKENYTPQIEDNPKEYVCKDCKSPVLIGESVIKDTESRHKTVNWKPQCMDCFKKTPRHGKMTRPSQEILQRLRDEAGVDIDEMKVRRTMRKLKNEVMGSQNEN